MPTDSRLTRVVVFTPSDDSYGLDRVLLRVVTALCDAGYDVKCLLERDNPGTGWVSEQLTTGRVAFDKVPLNNLARRHASSPLQFLRWLTLLAVRLPRMVAMSRRADLVYVNGFTLMAAALAGRLSRRPVMWHLHEIPPAGRRLGRLVRLLSTRQVCVSMAVADAFGLTGSGTSEVVYNPVDVPDVAVQHAPATPQRPVEIGIVARISRNKGHLVLAKAFRQLVQGEIPVRLHIVGAPHASDMSVADRLAEELASVPQNNVNWAGEVADGAGFMHRLHVLAAPSVFQEPLGLSVLEAMASGVAVVVSDVGGHRELVTDGVTGLVCRPSDAIDLERQLRRVVEDVRLRRALGIAARRDVLARFGTDAFNQSILAIARTAAEGSR